MSVTNSYDREPVEMSDLPSLADKWYFVGIDLAPVDGLETGIAVLDRERNIVRMEKLDTDKQLKCFLESLGPKSGLIIALDLPKNLVYSSKWRHQELKMHPLRATDSRERFSQRARDFYLRMTNAGYFVFNMLVPLAKQRYDIEVPFRSRSPQGCRALQLNIREELKLKNLPTNLAPTSVLDASIAAYTAWSLYAVQQGIIQKRARRFRPGYRPAVQPKLVKKVTVNQNEPLFDLYRDGEWRLYLDPLRLLDI